MKLLSWNIHRCIGSDGAYRPDRVRDVIRALDPDVVALQEVEQFSHDPGLLQFLCADSKLTAIPGITMSRTSGHYGNAILTRLPVRATRHVDLSVPGREPRGLIDIDCAWPAPGAEQLPDGVPLRVLATHLGLRIGERRRQGAAIVRLLTGPAPADQDQWTVLMGDFNDWLPGAWPLQGLQKYFPATPAPRTFPARRPLFALDRIWVRGPLGQVRIHAVNQPETRLASDHLPLFAEFTPG